MRRWNRNARPVLVGVLTGRKIGEHSEEIAVWCPFCVAYHYHGWDHRLHRHDVTHRGAHCTSPTSPFKSGRTLNGYYIGLAPRPARRST